MELKRKEFVEGKDFYWENGFVVFTREYHLRRGRCCGSGCRHCPFEPRWTKNTTAIAAEKQQTVSDQ